MGSFVDKGREVLYRYVMTKSPDDTFSSFFFPPILARNGQYSRKKVTKSSTIHTTKTRLVYHSVKL